MLCFRDMTFCGADCATVECPRQFTERDRQAAIRWWGGEGFPVAFGGFSANCGGYEPLTPSTRAEVAA